MSFNKRKQGQLFITYGCYRILAVFFITMSIYLSPSHAQGQGGDGDGYAQSQYLGSLSGNDLKDLYSGGNGDGFDKAGTSGIAGSSLVKFIARGGAGDGYSSDHYLGSLGGAELTAIFRGGFGDGFDVARAGRLIEGDYPRPMADCIEAYIEAYGNMLSGDQSSPITYQAVEAIHSLQVIRDQSIAVGYKAATEIELRAGFEVELGADFQVHVEGCSIQ